MTEIIQQSPIEFKHAIKEYTTTSDEPPTSSYSCQLITPDVNFTIPTRSCIYYQNNIFDFKSLENDENGKYVPEKFKNKAKFFDNRVNNTLLEISINDAKKLECYEYLINNGFSE